MEHETHQLRMLRTGLSACPIPYQISEYAKAGRAKGFLWLKKSKFCMEDRLSAIWLLIMGIKEKKDRNTMFVSRVHAFGQASCHQPMWKHELDSLKNSKYNQNFASFPQFSPLRLYEGIDGEVKHPQEVDHESWWRKRREIWQSWSVFMGMRINLVSVEGNFPYLFMTTKS